MNEYSKMAIKKYNERNFEVKGGHIQCCKVIWEREDVIDTATNLDVVLTEDEIDAVLYLMVAEHDAVGGLSWDTIECWIEKIVNDRKEQYNGS